MDFEYCLNNCDIKFCRCCKYKILNQTYQLDIYREFENNLYGCSFQITKEQYEKLKNEKDLNVIAENIKGKEKPDECRYNIEDSLL